MWDDDDDIEIITDSSRIQEVFRRDHLVDLEAKRLVTEYLEAGGSVTTCTPCGSDEQVISTKFDILYGIEGYKI